MDTHSFVVSRALKDAAIPTWEVQVQRQGKPVGLLHISRENFPPRKRKGKVVWQLPSDTSSQPKFGEHEKQRLYEIFKQQKKDRRKKDESPPWWSDCASCVPCGPIERGPNSCDLPCDCNPF